MSENIYGAAAPRLRQGSSKVSLPAHERQSAGRVKRVGKMASAAAPLVAKRDGAASEWCWDPMFFGDVFGAFDSVELGWRADRGRRVISTRDIRRGELIMRVPALARVLHSSLSASAHELDEFGLDAATVKLALAAIASSKAVVHALTSAHTATAASTVGSRIRRAQQLPPDLAILSDVERAPPTLGSQHRTLLAHVGVSFESRHAVRSGQPVAPSQEQFARDPR